MEDPGMLSKLIGISLKSVKPFFKSLCGILGKLSGAICII